MLKGEVFFVNGKSLKILWKKWHFVNLEEYVGLYIQKWKRMCIIGGKRGDKAMEQSIKFVCDQKVVHSICSIYLCGNGGR